MDRETIKQIGEAGINLSNALYYIAIGKINWDEVAQQIVKTGIGSLFIASITACFVGLVFSLQIVNQLKQFGAEHYIGALISSSAIRELGPIISAIIVAARVGSAISAEIGSMKSSEQIDALIVFGIDPVKYLVVPRLLASTIISPLLCSVATFVCIISGMLLVNAAAGVSFDIYLSTIRQSNTIPDVFVMLLKACIFGVTIAIVATTTGLQVRGGAEAVGDAVTKTIVWNFILIFIFNYFLSSYFFKAQYG